ncbi:MAG TPA: MarC family protein, partial [Burkholderiaceae bacterium]|nr:MarC family protein [Burkholderiaceae bacterium]
MDHSFLSALILLLLVLDPLGSLPIFIPIMRGVPKERRVKVALREVSIAFLVLFAFMFLGDGFLRVMHLSERSLEVAGGVILLIIAIRMIFGSSGESAYGVEPGREPLIFPLAVPLLAGPSAMATVLLLASRQPDRILEWVGALTAAMLISGLTLVLADRIRKLLGDSVVSLTSARWPRVRPRGRGPRSPSGRRGAPRAAPSGSRPCRGRPPGA